MRAQWPAFKVPRYTHTLTDWLNILIDVGFVIERVGEPRPHPAAIARCPAIADARIMPYFLHVRVRKSK